MVNDKYFTLIMLESVLSFPNLSFVGTSKESGFVDYPAASAPSLL